MHYVYCILINYDLWSVDDAVKCNNIHVTSEVLKIQMTINRRRNEIGETLIGNCELIHN